MNDTERLNRINELKEYKISVSRLVDDIIDNRRKFFATDLPAQTHHLSVDSDKKPASRYKRFLTRAWLTKHLLRLIQWQVK